ncbi:MAG: hypothetical protein AAB368_14745, partial [bacterium]
PWETEPDGTRIRRWICPLDNFPRGPWAAVVGVEDILPRWTAWVPGVPGDTGRAGFGPEAGEAGEAAADAWLDRLGR